MWNEALQKVPSSRISQSVCCSRFEFQSLFNIASNLVIFAVAGDLPDLFFIIFRYVLQLFEYFEFVLAEIPEIPSLSQVNKMLPLLIESYNLMKNSSSEDKAAAGDTDVEDPKSHPRLQD